MLARNGGCGDVCGYCDCKYDTVYNFEHRFVADFNAADKKDFRRVERSKHRKTQGGDKKDKNILFRVLAVFGGTIDGGEQQT